VWGRTPRVKKGCTLTGATLPEKALLKTHVALLLLLHIASMLDKIYTSEAYATLSTDGKTVLYKEKRASCVLYKHGVMREDLG